MTKAEKAALESYKRSNKARKVQLLARMGFKNQEAYFTSLGIASKTKAPAKKAPAKAAKAVKVTKVTKASDLAPDDSKPTDYVIAFDCTGSMAGYIESVKKHVTELVNELFDKTKDLRIKIVAFGDYCDMNSTNDFGKAYQVIELTDDRAKLINFIKQSTNTSGGDGDEFYELVIRKINNETDWRPRASKAVLLIGDAPYHKVGYKYNSGKVNIISDIDWKQEAMVAQEKGIQYDTLKIQPGINWYTELSTLTGGVSMDFKNAAKISNVIEGTVYARSSRSAYLSKSMAVSASGDAELIGAFKTISSLVD